MLTQSVDPASVILRGVQFLVGLYLFRELYRNFAV